jgi:hypothetical protein
MINGAADYVVDRPSFCSSLCLRKAIKRRQIRRPKPISPSYSKQSLSSEPSSANQQQQDNSTQLASTNNFAPSNNPDFSFEVTGTEQYLQNTAAVQQQQQQQFLHQAQMQQYMMWQASLADYQHQQTQVIMQQQQFYEMQMRPEFVNLHHQAYAQQHFAAGMYSVNDQAFFTEQQQFQTYEQSSFSNAQ